MRKSLAVLAASAAFLSLPAGYAAAGDHIVTPDAVQSRLSEAAAPRAQNVATVQEVLSTPIALEAAATLGADLGRVRAGYAADLLVVRGNPLEDTKLLYPGRGIEWTIKDGITYSARQLDQEVRDMVAAARGRK